MPWYTHTQRQTSVRNTYPPHAHTHTHTHVSGSTRCLWGPIRRLTGVRVCMCTVCSASEWYEEVYQKAGHLPLHACAPKHICQTMHTRMRTVSPSATPLTLCSAAAVRATRVRQGWLLSTLWPRLSKRWNWMDRAIRIQVKCVKATLTHAHTLPLILALTSSYFIQRCHTYSHLLAHPHAHAPTHASVHSSCIACGCAHGPLAGCSVQQGNSPAGV